MSDETNSGEYTEVAAPVANESYESNQQEQKTVPLDALQAERQERQKLQEEVRMMKDHLSLMATMKSQEAQRPASELEKVSDDDVMTFGDFKKALGQKEREYQANIKEIRISQKYPDYTDVVTKYLPEVLKNNPSLQHSLASSQDYELAYYLAKNSDSYKSDNKKVKKSADAEKILQNSQRAGSLSSVGQNSPINNAKRYKEMSDADFKREMMRNIG